MVASIVVAAVLAMVLQDRAFTDVMDSLQGGYVISTGQTNIDALLNKGGIQSMMWTLSLSLLAFALGGLMHTFDFLTVLLRGLLNRIQAAATLMTTTIAACFVGNMTLGDSYLSIIMGCQVFKEKYQQQGLQSRLLSRCVEEGGTLTTSLVPWSPSAAFYFSILGVTAWEYAPFVLLALVNPVVSIVLAYLGFGILRRSANEVVGD
jgi:NhaC family Na+:H+ antiporter